MKTQITFCFLLFSIITFAQHENLKHDYIWLTGYSSNPIQLEFGGTVIDFNHQPVETYYEFRDIDFDIASLSMCNADGEIIFSSNNRYIANRLDEPMENGEGLNAESNAFQDRVIQAILGLPSPNLDSTYVILHQQTDLVEDFNGHIIAIFNLHKTIVDMKFDTNPQIGDLGKVVEKNSLIIEDTLAFGRLTATRHANGRDWWILQQKYGTNQFYRFLLNTEGLIELESQTIGDIPLHNVHGVGQAVFSPDGSKYISSNNYSTALDAHIDFFDFDRCTGLLSNYERIVLDPAGVPNGVTISPNSEYAYFIYNRNYYQIDLSESPKELLLIQEYDDTLSRPFIGQLAPNGKIYFSGTATLPEMHIIHNPNEEGADCDIEQHGLQLPTFNAFTIPNHPNYRLGPIDGSPCDTLGIDNMLPLANFSQESFTDTVYFQDLSAGAPTDWYWTFGDGESSSEKHPSHIYPDGGSYEVCLTVNNSIGSDMWCDTVQIITTDIIERQELKIESLVFPNPSDGLILLQTEQNLPQGSHFKVYDQAGRLTFERELQSGIDKQNIELFDLPNGMYFYEILMSDFVIGKGKLVIQRG